MKNTDPHELHKFTIHAANWWDKNGPVKTLHDINPIRLEFIQNYTSLNGQVVLDVGCGGGILTESLAKAGAYVTAIDPNISLINVAKLHAVENQLTIDYHCTTAEELAVNKPLFDVITCMELLEHVPDPASLVCCLSTMLKPNGQLFLSTINRTLKAYAFAIIAAEHVLKLLPKGTHDYEKLIKPSELRQWCESSGLSLQHMKGIAYQPFSKRYSLTNDVSINYLFYAKKNND